jgi:predicted dehydrogenase
MSLKVAIIGTGNVAKKNYLPFLVQQDDVELSYFNRTQASAEACASEFGGWAADSIDSLMSESPDVVLLLTNENSRYQVALHVLQHKPKRLFFEKPLVAQQDQAHVTEDDFEKGRELLRLARSSGTETAMIFNYRFFDQSLLAQQLVAERGWGKLIQATGFVHYACWSHCIDLIHLFAGPVAEITALSGTIDHLWSSLSAKDVTAAFVTADGATGTILGTAGTSFAFPLYELLFSFEGGRLTLRNLDGDMEVLDYSGKRHEGFSLTRGTSQWDQYRQSFHQSLEAYLQSVRAGSAPPVPGIAGLQELQFEAALKRSIRLGRPVRPQDEFPLD